MFAVEQMDAEAVVTMALILGALLVGMAFVVWRIVRQD